MAKHGLWTVVFEDKMIIKKCEEFGIADARGYEIDDDAFWNDPKWANYHAIQFTDDNLDNDQVEFVDGSPNGEYDQATVGDFRSNFITRWDAAHLANLQTEWDEDVIREATVVDGEISETEESMEDQIARKGARPTSYTSA